MRGLTAATALTFFIVPALGAADMTVRLAIALQGGGSHGAFTWGVLDRLLQEPRFEIVAISGTSAGAMNAGILADGLRRGGAAEARKALARYWEDVGRLSGYAGFAPPAALGAPRTWNLEQQPSLPVARHAHAHLVALPDQSVQLQPAAHLARADRLRRPAPGSPAARIFICATNVRTGLRHVFENEDLSADVLLASAALPQVYQAVEIDGEHYWDGGYTGNPALAPLYLGTQASDLIVVGINPIVRSEVPQTARAIIDRIGEISFNASFMGEVAAIAFFEELMQSRPADRRFRRLFVHGIGDESLGAFGASSKMNSAPDFLRHLHEIGERAAERWLAETPRCRRKALDGRSVGARPDPARLARSAHPSSNSKSRFKHED